MRKKLTIVPAYILQSSDNASDQSSSSDRANDGVNSGDPFNAELLLDLFHNAGMTFDDLLVVVRWDVECVAPFSNPSVAMTGTSVKCMCMI